MQDRIPRVKMKVGRDPERDRARVHDHVRIEKMAFDGTLRPQAGGVLRPDRIAPGHGLTVKQADLDEFRVR